MIASLQFEAILSGTNLIPNTLRLESARSHRAVETTCKKSCSIKLCGQVLVLSSQLVRQSAKWRATMTARKVSWTASCDPGGTLPELWIRGRAVSLSFPSSMLLLLFSSFPDSCTAQARRQLNFWTRVLHIQEARFGWAPISVLAAFHASR